MLRLILLAQFLREFSEGGIDRNSRRKDIYFSFDFDWGERAVTVIVNVIDRFGEYFVLELLQDLWRRFGVGAPLDF